MSKILTDLVYRIMVRWIIAAMTASVELVNARCIEVVKGAKENEVSRVVLGRYGLIQLVLTLKGKGWWIQLVNIQDNELFIIAEDRLTNGAYAFNRKTVERLKVQYELNYGKQYLSDQDQIVTECFKVDYAESLPVYSMMDKILGRAKPIGKIAPYWLDCIMEISGDVKKGLTDNHSGEIELVRGARFCSDGILDKIIPKVSSGKVVLEDTKTAGFNKTLGWAVAEMFTNTL